MRVQTRIKLYIYTTCFVLVVCFCIKPHTISILSEFVLNMTYILIHFTRPYSTQLREFPVEPAIQTKTNETKQNKTKNIIANSIWCSQAVTHPSTNQTQRCLTSLIGREAVFSTWYGRWHETAYTLWLITNSFKSSRQDTDLLVVS